MIKYWSILNTIRLAISIIETENHVMREQTVKTLALDRGEGPNVKEITVFVKQTSSQS